MRVVINDRRWIGFRWSDLTAQAGSPWCRSNGRWCKGEGEDRDVIFLPVRLSCGGDVFRRLRADLTGAFEAEEFAGMVLGFHNAVCDQRHPKAGDERDL